MEPLISVIVPIYNVEKYLDQCIESIVNQTYRNLEIILVDDGSPDNCPEKCEKWAQKDSRIKVIHKKNAGLGFARNTGLEMVSGRYVIFPDSDDYFDLNMVELLHHQISIHRADAVYCSCNRVYNGEIHPQKHIYNDVTVFEGADIIDKVLLRMIGNVPEKDDGTYLYMSAAMCMFSREIIEKHGLRFCSERQFMCEDLAFQIDYLTKTKRVVYAPISAYNYRYNPGSLSTKVVPERFNRIKDMHLQLVEKLSGVMRAERFQNIEAGWFLSLSRGQIVSAVRRKGWKSLRDVKRITSDQLVQQTLAVFPYQRNPFPRRIFNFLIHRKWNLLIVIAVKYFM